MGGISQRRGRDEEDLPFVPPTYNRTNNPPHNPNLNTNQNHNATRTNTYNPFSSLFWNARSTNQDSHCQNQNMNTASTTQDVAVMTRAGQSNDASHNNNNNDGNNTANNLIQEWILQNLVSLIAAAAASDANPNNNAAVAPPPPPVEATTLMSATAAATAITAAATMAVTAPTTTALAAAATVAAAAATTTTAPPVDTEETMVQRQCAFHHTATNNNIDMILRDPSLTPPPPEPQEPQRGAAVATRTPPVSPHSAQSRSSSSHHHHLQTSTALTASTTATTTTTITNPQPSTTAVAEEEATRPAAAAAAPGATDDITKLPELRNRVRRHVHDVIMTSIPEEQSYAYRLSLQRPRDPSSSSGGSSTFLAAHAQVDALQFVRFCHYDLWAAAERLCLYWTERLKVFGPERFALPLTLTGHGALTKQDIQTVHAGFPAILQDFSSYDATTTTQQSSPASHCLYYDRRNWIPGATTLNKLRSCFYVSSLLAQHEWAQTTGVLAMVLAVAPRHESLDWSFVSQCMFHANCIFPVRIRGFHFLSIPNHKRPYRPVDVVTVATQIIQRFILSSSSYCYNTYFGNHHLNIDNDDDGDEEVDENRFFHNASSAGNDGHLKKSFKNGNDCSSAGVQFQTHIQTKPGKIKQDLLALGLSKYQIPMSFGGDWKIEDWYAWCQGQKEDELERYGTTAAETTTVTTTTTAAAEESAAAADLSAGGGDGSAPAGTSPTTTTTKAATVAAAGMKKRKRPTKAKTGGAAGANATTAPSSTPKAALTPEERLAKRRMADLLHSRRKRERRREEVRALHEESTKLVTENAELKRIQNYLMQLVQQVEQQIAAVEEMS